ncbi:MAG: RNA-binding protein [Bdellovibrionota bacterium]
MTTTLILSNLSPDISSSALEDMFSIVGNVRSATVLQGGFAQVEMATPEEAKNCVLHFDGQRYEGVTLVVRQKQAPRPATVRPVLRHRAVASKALRRAIAAVPKN